MTRGIPDEPTTLGVAFLECARTRLNETAFRFIGPGGRLLSDCPVASLSYAELEAKVLAVTARLSQITEPGDRALILCEPGTEYVAALWGCFCAGVIAVPAYPPMSAGPDERVRRLVEDSSPRALMTTTLLAAQCEAIAGDTKIVVVDELAPATGSYEAYPASPESIALLQYTSGSTGSPRGVMLSHTNVMSNVRAISQHLRISVEDQGVFWLPPYHDMGLMGGLLTPILNGVGTTFMSPLSFLYEPFLWLEAMTKYGTTISAAPNFAFELCVRKARERGTTDLDLSALRVLINGAEPVSYRTIEQFSQSLKDAGFRRSAFMPSYGLAEATLMVSGTRADEDVKLAAWSDDASRQGQDPEPLVSVGSTGDSGVVLIVNPDTQLECPDGEEGEIWFQGPGVASGYWHNAEATREVFGALVADRPELGRFLRTGDLGSLHAGELCIAGRIKDVLVIRGRNVYPHDLENTAIIADRRLRAGCLAAFEVPATPEPRVVIVAELRDDADSAHADEIWQAVRKRIVEEHGLALDELVLISRRTILKTTSGKIRRKPTRDAYLNDALTVVARRQADGSPAAASSPDAAGGTLRRQLEDTPAADRDALLLQAVCSHAAALLGEQVAAIDPNCTYAQLGLDSLSAIELASLLSEAIGVWLPSTLAYDHPTPHATAAFLRQRAEGTQQRSEARRSRTSKDTPIAIIGMGCRYPGDVFTPEDLWRLVEAAGDAIGEFPDDRGWDLDRLYNPDPDHVGASYTRHGGFVDGVADFDADFFGVSPIEAILMDPQQRLVLEGAWEAVERAGIDPIGLKGTDTGVFIGAMSYDYGVGSQFEASHGFGSSNFGGAMLSSRISYTLGVHGPAISLDAACSSSLVAVHYACQALREHECTLALAGGVTVLSHPGMFRLFSRQRRLAPDGRCKSFAAAADGAGFSEGMGLLLLESLEDAQLHGHRVLAIVRGSATGHDGASNGLTAPNGPSQERVIRRALANADVTPGEVDVIEAQGSGTAIGDAIEAQALLAAYADGHVDRPLWLGSVRSNIGHSHAAGGVAGVIKMVEAIRRRILPATLHVDEPTPHVDWSSGRLSLLTEPVQWTSAGPRRAGVSSFGATGANTHLILEEPPAIDRKRPAADLPPLPVVPLLLSGRTVQAVRDQADRLRVHLQADPAASPLDVAFSLVATRPLFEHRAAVLGADRNQLIDRLGQLARGDGAAGTVTLIPDRSTPTKVAFVFSPPSPSPGEHLEKLFPEFKQALDSVCDELDQHLDGAVRTQLQSGDRPGARPHAEHVGLAASATFALEIALFELVRSLGIEPDFLAGREVGYIAAACSSSVLSVEDAARLLAATVRVGKSAAANAVKEAVEDVRGYVRRCDPSPPIVDVWELDDTADVLVIGAPDGSGPADLTSQLTSAHLRGVEVSWHKLFEGRGADQVQLPTYPFQRKRYWPQPGDDLAAAADALSMTGQ